MPRRKKADLANVSAAPIEPDETIETIETMPANKAIESVEAPRRYAPEPGELEAQPEPMGLRGLNVPAMNEAQLRQFAMQHFGRRFQEGEDRAYMLRDVMSRMDVGYRSRNA